MQFPVNVEAVTVWEKTVVNRAPAYVRHELGACYWQDCRGQTVMQGDPRAPEDAVFLAVPLVTLQAGDYVPQKDDRVLPGRIAGDSPPRDALTVMQKKDFLFGEIFMQHMEYNLR